MRLDLAPGVVMVTLSRRNLQSLQMKLDHQPWSACTLTSGNAFDEDGQPLGGVFLFVRAESDESHYRDREPPGPMHPATEQLLAWPDQADKGV